MLCVPRRPKRKLQALDNSPFCSILSSLGLSWTSSAQWLAAMYICSLNHPLTSAWNNEKIHSFQWTWEVELTKPSTGFRSLCPISRRLQHGKIEALWISMRLTTLIHSWSNSRNGCPQGRGGSREWVLRLSRSRVKSGGLDRPPVKVSWTWNRKLS